MLLNKETIKRSYQLLYLKFIYKLSIRLTTLKNMCLYIQLFFKHRVSLILLFLLHCFSWVPSGLLQISIPFCKLLGILMESFKLAVLWGPVSRTCSVLLTAFLCNYHQAFSPYILLASTWCIPITVSILLLLGRNCTSFYRSGLISIRPIAYW